MGGGKETLSKVLPKSLMQKQAEEEVKGDGSTVTISKAEYEELLQIRGAYNQLLIDYKELSDKFSAMEAKFQMLMPKEDDKK